MNPAPLAMCVNADGPYWQSPLEVYGALPGVSLPRPFSYRREWVAPSLWDELAAAPGLLKGQLALVGMRFGDKEEEDGIRRRFVPIREVVIDRVSLDSEAHIWFTPLRWPRDAAGGGWQVADLGSAAFTAADSGRRNTLFLRTEAVAECVEASRLSGMMPASGWGVFSNTATMTPKAAAKFVGKVVSHIASVRLDGKTLKPRPLNIDVGEASPPKGFKLRTGSAYEILAKRRRLGPTSDDAFEPAVFRFSCPEPYALVSNPRWPQAGTYREHSVWLTPTRSSRAPLFFGVEPEPQENPQGPSSKAIGAGFLFRTYCPWWKGLGWFVASALLLGASVFGWWMAADAPDVNAVGFRTGLPLGATALPVAFGCLQQAMAVLARYRS